VQIYNKFLLWQATPQKYFYAIIDIKKPQDIYENNGIGHLKLLCYSMKVICCVFTNFAAAKTENPCSIKI